MSLLGQSSSSSNDNIEAETITLNDKIFFQNTTNKQKIQGNSNGDLSFFTNATEIIKINNIGTVDILDQLHIGAPNDTTDVFIGNPLVAEVKFRSDGNGHFSLFNMNGDFTINNTGASGNLGTTGIELVKIETNGNMTLTSQLNFPNGINMKEENWNFVLSTNSGSVMTLNDSGSVGIGTAYPLSNLHIIENNTTTNQLRLENSNPSGASGISLHNGTDSFTMELSNSSNRVKLYNGMGGIDYIAPEGDHRFYKGYSGSEIEQFRIKNDGTIKIENTIELKNLSTVPATITNRLYLLNGVLKFNGSTVNLT